MPPETLREQKPFLTLRQATFRLGDRLVFENTDWAFNQNEQWAIIGANGSGKSLLADGLRGRLPLVGGEMLYHFPPHAGPSAEESIGHVAFEDRKSELHGAVVQSRWTSFEEAGSLSVRDFLSFERVMEINPFEVDRHKAAARAGFQRRLRRAIRLFQVRDFLPRSLLSLSNGERQRVQLARALAQPLQLLILDEPYVGLDRSTRAYFHRLLEHLLTTPLKLLLLTARAEDLPRHITHLLWVDQCKVVAAGPRADILPGRNGRPVISPAARAASHRPRLSAGTAAWPADQRLQDRRQKRRTHPRSGRPKARAGARLVELHDVTVKYGKKVVLERVNWIVHEGESWALLGPNGAGKTTLLSLIQGDHPQAYTNEVVVFGQRRGTGESIWELKKRIGWVSPELQLHFDDSISVFEVVVSGFQDTIGVFDAPTARQAAAARRWLRQFKLQSSAELPLFSLSAGLQRMTLLARALVKQPRLLILDEPCQGLDPAHRELIVRSVDALIQRRAATAIFVTHRPEEIPGSIKKVLRLAAA